MSYSYWFEALTITGENLKKFGYAQDTHVQAKLAAVLETHGFHADSTHQGIEVYSLGQVAEFGPTGGLKGLEARLAKLAELTNAGVDQKLVVVTDEHGDALTHEF